MASRPSRTCHGRHGRVVGLQDLEFLAGRVDIGLREQRIHQHKARTGISRLQLQGFSCQTGRQFTVAGGGCQLCKLQPCRNGTRTQPQHLIEFCDRVVHVVPADIERSKEVVGDGGSRLGLPRPS